MVEFIEADRRDAGSHTRDQNIFINRVKKERPDDAFVAAGSTDVNNPSIADKCARRSIDGIDHIIASRTGDRGIGKGNGDISIYCESGVGGGVGDIIQGDDRADGTDGDITSDDEIQDSSFTCDNTINDSDIQGSRIINIGIISGREIQDSIPPNKRNVRDPTRNIRGGSSTTGGQVTGDGSGNGKHSADNTKIGGDTVKDREIQDFSFSGGDGGVKGSRESGSGNGTGGDDHAGNGDDSVINNGDDQVSSLLGGDGANAIDGNGGKSDNDNGGHSSAHSTSKGGHAVANSTSSGGGHAIATGTNNKGGLAVANSTSNGGNSIANSISDNGGNSIANSTSSNGGNSIANSTSSDGGNSIANSTSSDGGNSIANSTSHGGNSTANGTTSHGGNSTIVSTTGDSSSGDGGNSIVNSDNNGGNSTIVSIGGNSITDGQVRGNSSNGTEGDSGNDTTVGDNGLAIVSQNIDLIPQGSSGFAVGDRDTSIDYSSGWDLLVISPHTFHATSQAGPTLRHVFNGTQVIVVGLLPPGNGSVSANYSIDGGPPQSISLDPLSGTSSPVGNTTFFTSPILPFTNHTIDIAVTESGKGRNYSIDYLEIVVPSTLSNVGNANSSGARVSKANVGSIVGGVIGALILILCSALLYWLWGHRMRRKTAQDPEVVQPDDKKSKDHGSDINPYVYESQMHSDEKRIRVLPRSPLHSYQFTGSLNRISRSSVVAARTVSTPFDFETESRTVVWTGTPDVTRLPLPERKGTRRERHISV